MGARLRVARVAPLYAAGFITAFGAHGVATAVGGEHVRLGVTLAWLGVFLALYDVAELLLKPVFGALSDRLGPKTVIVGGLLVFAVASAFGIVVSGPAGLSLVRLGQGAGASAFAPSSSAALARLVSADARGRYFGRYGSWKALGYAGGPVIAAVVVTATGTGLLFAVLAVLALVTAIAVAVAVAPLPSLPKRRATVRMLVRELTGADFLRPVAVLAVGSAAVGILTGMLPALGTAVGMPLPVSAVAVAVVALMSALVQPRAGAAHDSGRLDVRAACAGGTALVAVGFALLAVIPGAVTLFVAAAVAGFGVAALTPVGFAQLAGSTPLDRLGRTMGSAELGREVGDAGGPLLVGAVASGATLPAGFGVFAVAAAVVAAAVAYHRREHAAEP